MDTNPAAGLHTTRKINRCPDFVGDLLRQSLAPPAKKKKKRSPAPKPPAAPKPAAKAVKKRAGVGVKKQPAAAKAALKRGRPKGGAAASKAAGKLSDRAGVKKAVRKPPSAGKPAAKSGKPAKKPAKAKSAKPPPPQRAAPKRVFTAADAPLSQGSNLDQAPYKWQFLEAPPHHWRDYDARASVELDAAWSTKDPDRMTVAVPSGDWSYEIDFNIMQQTNVNHPNHRQRAVRRVQT
ncbi:hypothetical protein DIPPA_06550 [Diplonema papillatum]|nr:hypothetical protein DIPPA_06550 [Diplonema papillatum]KAJ9462352.1 hypothetical protein DIPPA_06550 [Diplonema papillatum]KAJ9462353.1 hypothetical protein DIPPA_06550 [Diplonema papillatum]